MGLSYMLYASNLVSQTTDQNRSFELVFDTSIPQVHSTGGTIEGIPSGSLGLAVGGLRTTKVSPYTTIKLGAILRQQRIGFAHKCEGLQTTYDVLYKRNYFDVPVIFSRSFYSSDRFSVGGFAGINGSFTTFTERFYDFYANDEICDYQEILSPVFSISFQGGLDFYFPISELKQIVVSPYVDWSLPDLSPYESVEIAPGSYVLGFGVRAGLRVFDQEVEMKSSHNHMVYAEILGRTYHGASINYEGTYLRRGRLRMSVHAGFGWSSDQLAYLPVGLGFTYGSLRHSIEAVPSLVFQPNRTLDIWGGHQLGYRFENSSGIVMRANLTYLRVPSPLFFNFLMPGLSIGKTF